MTQLKFDTIKVNKTAGDKNTIVGTIDGIDIQVSRVAKGWSVHLQIVMGGHLVHECVPTAEEKEQFAELSERAFRERFVEHDQNRERILKSEAFKTIFAV